MTPPTNMPLIDTHTHLYLEEFQPDAGQAVLRALQAGVEHMIFPNVDIGTIAPMNALHEQFPDQTSMAMGLHPTELTDSWREDLQKIKEELYLNPGKYKGVGEIGIDLYWDKSYKERQIQALRIQLLWALELDIPVIIHCREGLDEILEIFDELPRVPQGVFHSFAGTLRDILRIRQKGDFYFGINGIVTFKNSSLKELLPQIGIERILLETDSPYLAPVPHRGRRNESAYLVDIARFVASSLGIPLEELCRRTGENADRLFRIS